MGQNDFPSEDSQFEVYRSIAQAACGKPVIIRTLDIGGDKQLRYLPLPPEDNPFLGLRAIRLCLQHTDMFTTQLRAALRASAFGDVKIMIPMIVTLEELHQAKEIIRLAQQQLDAQGVAYKRDVEIGIMVETPAAAQISDLLAQECDFFSIGSNDLIQYTAAADRMNASVQYLYDSCNISVLRSIAMTARSAATAGIPWGVCGEAASEECLTPFFVALGVSELSVAPPMVGRIKRIICRCNQSELSPFADVILNQSTGQKARRALEEKLESLQ